MRYVGGAKVRGKPNEAGYRHTYSYTRRKAAEFVLHAFQFYS